ncbi:DUF4312 family protein [Streptomyces sp. NPDC059740]|uniref:DUF4312 family protein n=1 Tax=Streptomyces sp. NPDC059740 TaxID=3346926 RepID=UPI00364C09D8
MNTSRHTLRLTGTGTSRERAFAEAMGQVQRRVGEKVTGTCIRIEPVDLVVESAVERRWTERFLGLLFPRRRTAYEITVRVEVQVGAVDLAAVDFRVVEEKLTPLQHALLMR